MQYFLEFLRLSYWEGLQKVVVCKEKTNDLRNQEFIGEFIWIGWRE